MTTSNYSLKCDTYDTSVNAATEHAIFLKINDSSIATITADGLQINTDARIAEFDSGALDNVDTKVPTSKAVKTFVDGYALGGELGGTLSAPTVNDGADGSAFHDDIAGEINALIQAVPEGADKIMFEMSPGWEKRECSLSAIFDALETGDTKEVSHQYVEDTPLTLENDLNMGTHDITNVGVVSHPDATRWLTQIAGNNIGLYWDTNTNDLLLKGYFGVDIGTHDTAIVCNFDKDGLQMLQSGARINEFSTDGTLAGNADTVVPTEKAVKTYVDNNAGDTKEEAHAFVEANALTLTAMPLHLYPATGTAAVLRLESSEDAYIEVEGDEDNDDEAKHAWASFWQDGRARFLHIGVGKEDNDNEGFITVYEKLLINTGALGSGTKRLEINTSGIDVIGNITVSGTVDGKDVSTLCTTAEAVQAVEDVGLVLSAGKVITSEDANLVFTFGKSQLGRAESSAAYFGQRGFDATNFALYQSTVRDTFLNAADGKTVYLGINNISKASLTVDGLRLSADARITEFDSGALDNVDTKVPTSKAVKTYVDNNILAGYGVIQLQKEEWNGATKLADGIQLNSVGEDCFCNFQITDKMDATEDMILIWTYTRSDAGGGGVDLKLYIGSIPTDGSSGLVWDIENATAMEFVGNTASRYYTHSYTIAKAGINADDWIRIFTRLNEAGRDIQIYSITLIYKKV